MKHTPFFSILTASLNKGDTIEQNLASVRDQSFADLEHIVIDGGSQDNTLACLERYQDAYPMTWISEPDKGISDALNKGVNLSHGRFVLVLQADDLLISPSILDKAANALSKKNCDIMSFPVLVNHPEKGLVRRNPIRLLWWNHFKFIFPHQGCLVHRRVFDRAGLFDTRFRIAMDYDFFYRALATGAKVSFGNFPLAIMGSQGVGTDVRNTRIRLSEERLVQTLNESGILWRMTQVAFQILYRPYKQFIWRKIKGLTF